MAIDNQVSFSGNLTRDPELRFTKNGMAVVNMGVAINENFQDKDGEWQSSASFVDVTAWGDLAENVADCLVKGDRVSIRGKIKQQTWETDEGENRSKVEFVADDVAASLKWATVDISKVEKDDHDDKPARGKSSSRGRNSGSSRGGRSGSSGSGGRSRRESENSDDEDDFDPFD